MHFDKKKWLDLHVVPLVKKYPSHLYGVFTQGHPPTDVLAFLMVGAVEGWVRDAGDPEAPPFDPDAWPAVVHGLIIDEGFRFDFLRERVLAPTTDVEGGSEKAMALFGSDGAPLISPDGLVAARLFKKMDDSIGLIFNIGCHYPGSPEHKVPPAKAAADGVKRLFARFEGVDPLAVCQQFSVAFGAA